MSDGALAGKKGLIFGIANHRSIAWAIAQAATAAGARVALAYQGERVERYVRDLAGQLPQDPPPLVLPCDLTDDGQITALYGELGRSFGSLDFVVHSVAFAQKEDLEGRYVDTSRHGFATAMEVSVYSLTAAVRAALPLMTEGGSVITMTYLGAARAVPSYNVMGVAKAALESSVRYLAADLGPQNIRVNAISAGPIQTLSARGIAGFGGMLGQVRDVAPLRRNTDPAEVADTAVFLCSHLSRGITGEVIYVDSGFHILPGLSDTLSGARKEATATS